MADHTQRDRTCGRSAFSIYFTRSCHERAIGLAGTVRFFSQVGLGEGNYSEERRALFAGLTLDDYRLALSKMPLAANDAGAGQ